MKFKMLTKASFIFIALAIILGGIPLIPASAYDLVVTAPGGASEKAWRKYIIEPFEQKYSGTKIGVVTGLTMQLAAKMRAQKNDVKIDVFMMDPVGALQCEVEGLYEQITEEKVPNLKNFYPYFLEKQKGHPWVHRFWVMEALWYNTEHIKPAPTSWKVMFDPKYSGRISFPDINTSHGVWMLNMASRIHGGDLHNMDPGFEAIKKIRPGIKVLWTVHGQIQQLFARGDIWLTSDSTDRCARIMQDGVSVDWTVPKEGAYLIAGTIGIAKGTKNLDLAYRYVNFALDGERQAMYSNYSFVSPVVKGAPVNPEWVKKHYIPSGDYLDKVLDLDWKEVNKLRPDWTDRWRREIAIK